MSGDMNRDLSREIVLDTETTGLSPGSGDRVVEIGCVELVNHIPTGRHYHAYLNPQRTMPEEAFRVHGLSDDFLKSKPLFRDEASGFLDFIESSTLIIHNAPFDLGFLNAELEWIKQKALTNQVIDTVQLARQVHPGARVSLDALCKHYGIDTSKRSVHGALLDSQILAEVYLELIGGRQVALSLGEASDGSEAIGPDVAKTLGQRPAPLPQRLTDREHQAHQAAITAMGEGALWRKYSTGIK